MIEVGKVVLPALGGPARLVERGIAAGSAIARAVVQARKCGCDLRCRGQEFLQFLPVDREVGEAFVGHPASEAVQPADAFVFSQRAGIEIEPLYHLHQYPRGQRSLIALDQI